MSEKMLIKNIAVAAILLLLTVTAAFAQKKDKNRPSQDPNDKARTVKAEPNRAYSTLR